MQVKLVFFYSSIIPCNSCYSPQLLNYIYIRFPITIYIFSIFYSLTSLITSIYHHTLPSQHIILSLLGTYPSYLAYFLCSYFYSKLFQYLSDFNYSYICSFLISIFLSFIIPFLLLFPL